jgi:uncharacterized protein
MANLVTRVEVEQGLWLDSRRAVWIERSRRLVLADLHWGYAASHRAAGSLLPLWGDEDMARTLDELIGEYRPTEMIWLGDVIHAAAGRSRAESYLSAAPVPIVVLLGNHDRRWQWAESRTQLRDDGFLFHHGHECPQDLGSDREMVGHHHPAAVLTDRAGSHVKLPALVTGPRRWVLPAFSPWAAGVAWNHELAEDETLWAISPRRILPIQRPR